MGKVSTFMPAYPGYRRIWDMSTSSALRVTCTPRRSSWTWPAAGCDADTNTQHPRTTVSRSKSESLLGLTESFFHNYLKQTRGASGHTVRAYRDALKLCCTAN